MQAERLGGLVELIIDGTHGSGWELFGPLGFVGEADVTLRNAASAAASAAATSTGLTAAAPLRGVPQDGAAIGRGGRPLLLGPSGIRRVGTA